jgi:hypothetical protein
VSMCVYSARDCVCMNVSVWASMYVLMCACMAELDFNVAGGSYDTPQLVRAGLMAQFPLAPRSCRLVFLPMSFRLLQ